MLQAAYTDDTLHKCHAKAAKFVLSWRSDVLRLECGMKMPEKSSAQSDKWQGKLRKVEGTVQKVTWKSWEINMYILEK